MGPEENPSRPTTVETEQAFSDRHQHGCQAFGKQLSCSALENDALGGPGVPPMQGALHAERIR